VLRAMRPEELKMEEGPGVMVGSLLLLLLLVVVLEVMEVKLPVVAAAAVVDELLGRVDGD